MTAEMAIMDQQENVRGAFTRSLLFHAAIVGGLTSYAYLNGALDTFGAKDAGMPAVGVNTVDTIPLPSRGPKNPVAEDTESDAPQEVAKPEPKVEPKAEPEPEDAISLLPPDRKKAPLTPKSKLIPFDQLKDNQLTSKSPQAMSTPMMQAKGGNQINVGGDTTLGDKFPEYAAAIQEITRRGWHTEEIDRNVTNGPPVTIRFELQKNGKVTGIRLVKRTGIISLDLSVQNAVESANYPPLPPGFNRDSVPVEFTMVLKR
ncbi:MAG: TonB family protein [Bryobacteraceae bacterium]